MLKPISSDRLLDWDSKQERILYELGRLFDIGELTYEIRRLQTDNSGLQSELSRRDDKIQALQDQLGMADRATRVEAEARIKAEKELAHCLEALENQKREIINLTEKLRTSGSLSK